MMLMMMMMAISLFLLADLSFLSLGRSLCRYSVFCDKQGVKAGLCSQNHDYIFFQSIYQKTFQKYDINGDIYICNCCNTSYICCP